MANDPEAQADGQDDDPEDQREDGEGEGLDQMKAEGHARAVQAAEPTRTHEGGDGDGAEESQAEEIEGQREDAAPSQKRSEEGWGAEGGQCEAAPFAGVLVELEAHDED